jgi:quercetin dioxygenase-like cupin family protein
MLDGVMGDGMKRTAFLIALAALLVVSTRAQQPPAGGAAGSTPRFTGKSEVMDGKDLSIARRHFDAGARTAWHSHDRGQLLMVEEGRMRAQKRGQPIKEFGVGESEYTAPSVVHWHGAASGQPLVQLNVGFGGGSKWFEDVTEAEYQGRK